MSCEPSGVPTVSPLFSKGDYRTLRSVGVKPASRWSKSSLGPPYSVCTLERRFHVVIHFCCMSHTITVRLTSDLAEWLEMTAKKSGVPQGKIIRDQLERARASEGKSFMHLAGVIDGPRDLSKRKGFAKR